MAPPRQESCLLRREAQTLLLGHQREDSLGPGSSSVPWLLMAKQSTTLVSYKYIDGRRLPYASQKFSIQRKRLNNVALRFRQLGIFLLRL
jgi:hypothetical protein